MVVGGSEHLDRAGVLQVPQERAAVDDPVHAGLEARVRERLEQGAGQRQVHAPDILVLPQRAGDPVKRPEDLLGLPRVAVE